MRPKKKKKEKEKNEKKKQRKKPKTFLSASVNASKIFYQNVDLIWYKMFSQPETTDFKYYKSKFLKKIQRCKNRKSKIAATNKRWQCNTSDFLFTQFYKITTFRM